MSKQYSTLRTELNRWDFTPNIANNAAQAIARYLSAERIPDEHEPRAYAYPTRKMRIICAYYAIRHGYPLPEPPSSPTPYYIASTTEPQIGFNVMHKTKGVHAFFTSFPEAQHYVSYLNLCLFDK